MARAQRTSEKTKNNPVGGQGMPPPVPPPAPPGQPDPPAGILMFFRDGAEAEGLEHVRTTLGQREVVRSEDTDDQALPVGQAPEGGMAVFSRLGLAFTRADQDQIQTIRSSAAAGGPVEAVIATDEPLVESKPAVLAAEPSPAPRFLDYLRGYRDAVNNLAEASGIGTASRTAMAQEGSAPAEYRDDPRGTWGLHATGVLNSRYTGRGVRVAALVDGLDTGHRDWAGRQVVMRSFVPGELPADGGASGTHYLGTAFGAARPSTGPRYGCAPGAVLFVAKVLSRTGSGSRTAIFSALDWAVANNCRVILAPLGWGGPASDIFFESVASRVASRGGLLIAGAGNNARRNQGEYGFVNNPAACPSVIAVGSIDARLNLSAFTPRSSTIPGGAIDLVGPGVNLRSSVPRPQLYTVWSGSATAAAYAAGIAALWGEALPNATAHELWQALVSHARPLPLPASDAGAGLVQAP